MGAQAAPARAFDRAQMLDKWVIAKMMHGVHPLISSFHGQDLARTDRQIIEQHRAAAAVAFCTRSARQIALSELMQKVAQRLMHQH
jgi:hypothetical protein